MATTTRLGLQLLSEAQNQKSLTVNAGLNSIDAAIAGLTLANTFTNTNTFTGASKLGGTVGGNAGVPIRWVSASITFPSSADYTLTATEAEAYLLTINTTNIAGALNMIVPQRADAVYLVTNNSGFAITTKTSGGTGIAIASNRRAWLVQGGSFNITRASADVAVTP